MKITIEVLLDIPDKDNRTGRWEDILGAETAEEVNEANKKIVAALIQPIKTMDWIKQFKEYGANKYGEITKTDRVSMSFPFDRALFRLTNDRDFMDFKAADAFFDLKRKGWL